MRTIFIVDDQEINLLLIKTALDGLYKTYALNSIEKMLTFAEKIKPDLILLDIIMPDINGFKALQMIKDNEHLKSVPVVFLSAKNDDEAVILGFKMGAIDFIEKPFSTPILIKRIETYLLMEQMAKTIQSKNEELQRYYEAETKNH